MSDPNTQPGTSIRSALAWLILVCGLGYSAYLIFGKTEQAVVTDAPQATPASVVRTEDGEIRARTQTIDSIRVGDRVLAHNPEVPDEERAGWAEPVWEDWLQLTLKMPLPPVDGDVDSDVDYLDIQILRPESWLLERYGVLVDPPEPGTATPIARGLSDPAADEEPPLKPTRPALREITSFVRSLQADRLGPFGLTVELDLPEMGASGMAVVTGIKTHPVVREGEGRVVTATFSHPPSRTVLNVTFTGDSEPIGVTDNHLFWSEDQQRFLPIGRLKVGEQVRTIRGELKRIESKLPRPGPQLVYNLEVHGEHVYYVGDDGVLAHNAYEGAGAQRVTRSRYKQLRRRSPNDEIRRMVNPASRKGPHTDPALGSRFVDDILEADHIVPLKQIVGMPGFARLTFEQQIQVVNFRRNFIGLVKSSNASKGAKTWSGVGGKAWEAHKRSGTPVREHFRRKMIKKENKVRKQLQQMIDDMLAQNTS